MDIKKEYIIDIFSEFIGWGENGGCLKKNELVYVVWDDTKQELLAIANSDENIVDLDLCVAVVHINDTLDDIVLELTNNGHNIL